MLRQLFTAIYFIFLAVSTQKTYFKTKVWKPTALVKLETSIMRRFLQHIDILFISMVRIRQVLLRIFHSYHNVHSGCGHGDRTTLNYHGQVTNTGQRQECAFRLLPFRHLPTYSRLEKTHYLRFLTVTPYNGETVSITIDY